MATDLEKRTLMAKIADGWSNVLTSIGVKGKDKRMSATAKWERQNREDLEHFYSSDDIAGNIVDVVPEESLSKGYKIKGIDDMVLHEKVMTRLRELKTDAKILEAWLLSRIHGGSGIVKITEDARLDLPMPTNKKILALNVVDRWELQINSTQVDTQITSPRFGDPIYYQLQLSEGADSKFEQIHSTRVVRFDGAYLPKRIKRMNQYWGDSILTKLYNPIRNYQISNDAAALTIQDFDIPVLKIQNMAELMSSNCDDQVIKRLEMVNLSKSIAKMIVLDAEKEDFEHKSRNVTGMKDVLDKIEARLVTAAKMPRTKLFGESSGGLGSTGESQLSNWYDYIEAQQTNFLKPKLLEIVRYVIQTEFPSIDLKKVDIEFVPLWQMSEKEEADLRKVVADTDKVYIDAQVVDPTEIALSRFGGDKYSKDTVIDKTLREQNTLIGADPVEPAEEEVEEPDEDDNSEETLQNLIKKSSEISDGGPGSGPQGGAGDKISKTTEALKTAMEKESKFAEQIKSLQKSGDYSSEAYKTAAKNYKSAVRARQKAVREAKTILSVANNLFKKDEKTDFILKKGFVFEHDFTMKDRHGEALNLDGYDFKLLIKQGDNAMKHDFIKKVEGEDGKVRIKIPTKVVDELEGISELMIDMTRPNGTSKIVKTYKVGVVGN